MFLDNGPARMLETYDFDIIVRVFCFFGGIVEAFCGMKHCTTGAVVLTKYVDIVSFLFRRG